MSELGERLEWVCDYFQISRSGLAAIADRSPAWVSQIIRGDRKGRGDIVPPLRNIANELQLSLPWLLTGEGERFRGQPASGGATAVDLAERLERIERAIARMSGDIEKISGTHRKLK